MSETDQAAERAALIEQCRSYIKTRSPAVFDTMSFEQYAALPEDLREGLQGAARDVSRLDGPDVLKQRIFECITVQTLMGEPMRPRTLTLQFARTAARHGVKLNDLTVDLASEGLLRQVIRTHGKAWLNRRLLDHMKTMESDVLELLDRIVDNSI